MSAWLSTCLDTACELRVMTQVSKSVGTAAGGSAATRDAQLPPQRSLPGFFQLFDRQVDITRCVAPAADNFSVTRSCVQHRADGRDRAPRCGSSVSRTPAGARRHFAHESRVRFGEQQCRDVRWLHRVGPAHVGSRRRRHRVPSRRRRPSRPAPPPALLRSGRGSSAPGRREWPGAAPQTAARAACGSTCGACPPVSLMDQGEMRSAQFVCR